MAEHLGQTEEGHVGRSRHHDGGTRAGEGPKGDFVGGEHVRGGKNAVGVDFPAVSAREEIRRGLLHLLLRRLGQIAQERGINGAVESLSNGWGEGKIHLGDKAWERVGETSPLHRPSGPKSVGTDVIPGVVGQRTHRNLLEAPPVWHCEHTRSLHLAG